MYAIDLMGDGFLPLSRAPLLLDLLVLAMIPVLTLQGLSIVLVKRFKRFRWHKNLQITLAVLLGLVLSVFELEMRNSSWAERAEPSRYYETLVYPILVFHLIIAITTTLLWIVTVTTALRRFPDPPRPAAFSASHIKLARFTASGTLLTALTGWLFYFVAFVG